MADQPEGVPTARDVLDKADRCRLADQPPLALKLTIEAGRLLDARLSALEARPAPACERCAEWQEATGCAAPAQAGEVVESVTAAEARANKRARDAEADLARLTAAGPVMISQASHAYFEARAKEQTASPGGVSSAGLLAVVDLVTARTRVESTAALRAAEERAAEAERQRDEWRSAWDTLARTAPAPEPGPFDFPAIEWRPDGGCGDVVTHKARVEDRLSADTFGTGEWCVTYQGTAPDEPTARATVERLHRLVTAPAQPSGATGPATDEELRRVEEDTRRDVAESGRAAGVGAQMIAVHAAPAVRRALYEHGRAAPTPGREERGEGARADGFRAGWHAGLGLPDATTDDVCDRHLASYLAARQAAAPSTPPRAEAPTVEQTFRVERVADDNGNISVRATVASQRTITRSPPRAEAPAPGAGRTVERPPFGYVVHYGGGRWKMTVLNRQDAEEEAECSPGAEAVPLYRHAAPTPGAGLTVGEPVWTDGAATSNATIGRVHLHAYKTHGGAPQPAAWVALIDNRSIGTGTAPDIATAKRAAFEFACSLNGATPAPRGLTEAEFHRAWLTGMDGARPGESLRDAVWRHLGPIALPAPEGLTEDDAERLAAAWYDDERDAGYHRHDWSDRAREAMTERARRVLTSLGAPAGTGGGRGKARGRETRRLLFVALMAAFFDGSQVGADPCTRDAAEAALLRHLGITPSPPTPPPVGEGEGRVE